MRDLDPAVIAEIQADVVRPVMLFRGDFIGGTVFAWTGIGVLEWDGAQWQGVGTLGMVTGISETPEIRAQGVTVTLSGIPSDMIALAIGAVQQGADGRIYIALLDAAGALIGVPYLAFRGRLDVPTISDSGETSTVSITYESRLIDLERAREWRYTDEDQKSLYPGDRGLEYVAGLQDKTFVWGSGKY